MGFPSAHERDFDLLFHRLHLLGHLDDLHRLRIGRLEQRLLGRVCSLLHDRVLRIEELMDHVGCIVPQLDGFPDPLNRGLGGRDEGDRVDHLKPWFFAKSTIR